jgi:hypothetical protein
VGLTTVLLTLLPAAAWACAVCWDGESPLARALNTSILFLMSMPFLIGGAIISTLYVAHKRARGQRWPWMARKDLALTHKEGAQ